MRHVSCASGVLLLTGHGRYNKRNTALRAELDVNELQKIKGCTALCSQSLEKHEQHKHFKLKYQGEIYITIRIQLVQK